MQFVFIFAYYFFFASNITPNPKLAFFPSPILLGKNTFAVKLIVKASRFIRFTVKILVRTILFSPA